LQLSASDADLPKQTLTFSLVSGPAGLAVSPNGQLAWMTAATTAPGASPVSVQVSDGVDIASAMFQVTVSAALALPQPSPGIPAPPPGMTAPQPQGPNQLFVEQLYLDLLGRLADPSGLQLYVGLLDGGLASRLQVVQFIENSLEFRIRQIEIIYGTFLDRPTDPLGLQGWLGFLRQGGTLEQVKVAILASPEYFLHAGGTINGFLVIVYGDLFDRTVDPSGALTWGQALAGSVSRLAVVIQILSTPEGIAARVKGLYGVPLHRPADPLGFAGLAGALANGLSDEQALAILAASDEYFIRAVAGP
jgi:hypothetical protein